MRLLGKAFLLLTVALAALWFLMNWQTLSSILRGMGVISF